MSDNCTPGCHTRDHASYSECLKSKQVRVAYCDSSSGRDATTQKKWDANLDRYRALRNQGIQPSGTKPSQVNAADRISNATGTAYKGA